MITAAALMAAGGAETLAWQHGLWGTALVALLAGTGFAAALCRPAPDADDIAPAGDGGKADRERFLLRALVDQAPGALLAVEGGDRVRSLNRAARRLFATDDLLLPPPAPLLDPQATRWQSGGRSWRIDRVEVAGLGASRTLVALVDVQAEEHAAEARATRTLLRVLGHEVMNALAPIASLAESAMAALDRPDSRDRLLPEILGTLARRADGLRRFTEAYRLVGRLPEPTRAAVPLDALFEDMARLFEGQWHGRVAFEADAPPRLTASIDRAQMTQALWALLQNGAEAALAGTGDARVALSAVSDGAHLRLRVADTGPGVDPAYAKDMFSPFITTKRDGNGIGLTAARQIAQGHGGDIVHLAGPPTMFEIFLPG